MRVSHFICILGPQDTTLSQWLNLSMFVFLLLLLFFCFICWLRLLVIDWIFTNWISSWKFFLTSNSVTPKQLKIPLSREKKGNMKSHAQKKNKIVSTFPAYLSRHGPFLKGAKFPHLCMFGFFIRQGTFCSRAADRSHSHTIQIKKFSVTQICVAIHSLA